MTDRRASRLLAALAEEMMSPLPSGTVLPCMDPAHGDECEARRVAGYIVLPPAYDPGADEWAAVHRALGKEWCRPCGDWHNPPECWIDTTGRSRLDQPPGETA